MCQFDGLKFTLKKNSLVLFEYEVEITKRRITKLKKSCSVMTEKVVEDIPIPVFLVFVLHVKCGNKVGTCKILV